MSVVLGRDRASGLRRGAYWAATGVVAAEAGIGGLLDLLHRPPFFPAMLDLGYPPYFATILGAAKLAAVPALLAPGLPRLTEWAYAGVVFTLLGASVSHLAVADSASGPIVPLAFAALAAVSWALRPLARRTST